MTPPPGAAAQPRPKRRLAWIIAALLGAVFVVLPAAWQAGAYGVTRTGTLRGATEGRPVTALRIMGGGADIAVSPRADQQVGYRAEVSWSRTKPSIEQSWHEGTLTLTPHCSEEDSWPANRSSSCSVRLGVTVPAGLPVTVSSVSGRVEIGGLGGAVDVRVDSGQLGLTGLRGPVHARIGSGTLLATALTTPEAVLSVGSGRADIGFVTPPDHVTADIRDGHLALNFPEATRFRVATRTGTGRIGLAPELSDPASPRILDLSAGDGGIDAQYPQLLP
ncbi:hypothetical protein ACFXDJ_28775 [Streptomyces sp. NPDC059443]|uniref:hypothetical protein n=1 Tax=unclassified Streptomyces TaxID=2593676 RepID=UPI0036A9C2CA